MDMSWTRRAVAQAAWMEYRSAMDLRSPTLARMDVDNKEDVGRLGEVTRATARAPRGWENGELGFGFCEGPSIMATATDVLRARAQGGVLMGDRSIQKPNGSAEAKGKNRAPKRTGADWQRTLRAHTGR